MKYVVTGANGFTGRRMVEILLEQGSEVVALSRDTEWLTAHQHPRLRALAWTAEQDAPLDALANADALFHLAAFRPPNQNDSAFARQCLEVNALGTLKLLEAALQASVRRFVYFSAGNSYLPLPRPAAEDDPLFPAHRATFYLASKIVGELYAAFFHHARALPVTTLRVSSIYGRGMTEQTLIRRFIASLQAGKPIIVEDGGRFTADFVDVDDVIRLALLLTEQKADGSYNAGSGTPLSTLELAQHIVRALNASPELIHLQPAATASAGFSALDITKAKSLGYAPVQFSQGLASLLQWLEQVKGVTT
ncbi:MAG: NAD-dependent epimerase/dehydratase family protein [Chloroflexota bacterium]